MPKYGWKISAKNAAGEELTKQKAGTLEDLAIHNVVSALKRETVSDVVPGEDVTLYLFATRTVNLPKPPGTDANTPAKTETLFAPVGEDRKLPMWFRQDARNNGPYVHADLHDELAKFKTDHANLLAATPEEPPVALEPPVAT
jgi:hypothetical protein